MGAVTRRRCNATVERRDTYRLRRDGKLRFAMHYQKGQCERFAVEDGEFCRQHEKMRARLGTYPRRWRGE